MIELLEVFGIYTTRQVSHPYEKQETPPPVTTVKPADDTGTVLASWGSKRHRPKRRIEHQYDEERRTEEWAIPQGDVQATHMPEELTRADEQEIAKLGKSTSARDNYIKARPFIIQGATNPELAEKLGWSLSTAQKVGARVRAAIKKHNSNPSPTQ